MPEKKLINDKGGLIDYQQNEKDRNLLSKYSSPKHNQIQHIELQFSSSMSSINKRYKSQNHTKHNYNVK